MRKKTLVAVNSVISLILVAAILHFVGVEEVLSELGQVQIGYFLLGIAALFLMDLAMSWRIKILLEGTGSSVRFLDILKSHFVGMLLADFTPSRTGYFATAATLKYNYNAPSEKALLSIFGPQMFEFAFKIVIGGLAILYILLVFIGPDQGIVLLAGIVGISFFVAMMLLILFSRRFLKLFSFAQDLPFVSRFYKVVMRMQNYSHVVIKKAPHIITLLLVSWAFRALCWHFIGKAVGITLDLEFPELLFYFFLYPTISMLEFLPSPTIAGLGLSEGGVTLVFSLFGILPAKAALFALLVRFGTSALHAIAIPEALRVPEGVKL